MRARVGLVVLVLVLDAGCATPSGGRTAPPPPGTTTPIDCMVNAIGDVGPSALPAVNSLLAGGLSSCDAACESRVTTLIGTYGVDVVACMIKRQAQAFGQAAERDPADQVSSLASSRAREIVRQRGWIYVSP